MLSEEEIINIINKFFDTAGTGNVPFYVAVKGLLDLYKKEKEKNDTLQTNYEILQGEMDRIGIDILGLEPGNSTDDVIDKIKALLKENRKLRNCHLRYEEITGIDLLMED